MASTPLTETDPARPAATPEDLVVMLLDAGLRVLDQAWQARDLDDSESQTRQMALAGRILAELETAIDASDDVGAGLRNIFRSLKNRLHDRDALAITDGILLLRPIRQLWAVDAASVAPAV